LEEFVIRSNKIHCFKYDYSLTKYINSRSKIEIICPLHGIFEQKASAHLSGFGCILCASEKRKLTTEKFIEKAKLIHNNKYDYSLTKYINSRSKVEIICPLHGIFEQKASAHLNGQRCPDCFGSKKLTTEEFIEKAKLIHNKYDYSLTKYINSRSKVEIICPLHGIFEQKASSHLRGFGCILCAVEKRKLTTEEFIEKAKLIHNNKYDYSLTEYIKSNKRVIINCYKHGKFLQLPNSHLNGNGCPNCKSSKGENSIKKFLIENDIKFESQKTFDGCVYKKKLRFDFYLPEKNLVIEYDGEQHFNSVEKFGGEEEFNKRRVKDRIKNDFCIKNSITILRIKYDDDLQERLRICNG